MVWALILAFALAKPAYAEDLVVVSEPEPVQTLEEPQQVGSTDPTVEESENKDAKEESTVGQVPAEEREQGKKELPTEDVEEKREEQPVEDNTAEVEYAVPLSGTRAAINLTAWANANPTSQYAHYAEGLLSEVPYDGHYVFMQDSQQSYVFVVGKGDSISNLTDCKWWRWYNTQGYGYRIERGTGSVQINTNDYTVLSDFPEQPSLVEESGEVTRREIMLYALVAVSVFSLYHVLGFCIRVSGSN